MIYIDGVVGVGKSTLAKIVAEKLGKKLFKEPVFENPILDKFYYDKKRYSFSLQVFLLNKRLELIKESIATGSGVFDRSIYCDKIFADILHTDGDLSTDEFNLYLELSENMFKYIEKPKLIVYLETSVDNAVDRIKSRGRDFEQVMPRDYWEKLNNHYREYFDEYKDCKVIKFNVDSRDFLNNPKDREEILAIIEANIN
ncbi:MAG: deoxynucleoside kinase [Fusobacteriaceae bacterium]